MRVWQVNSFLTHNPEQVLNGSQGSEINHQRRGSKEKYVTIQNYEQQTYCI